ncbi:MAG: ribosome silencing factor [Synergistaceae bacterium]|nr:ribosome silencing factor [Synergistota bacterium]NLM70616.1 ribosome silencing factor [Synergistaceae bacterium]
MNNQETGLKKFEFLYEALADKRGFDIVALDLGNTSAVSDIFVLVTANSDLHMDTLRDTALETLRLHGYSTKTEGNDSARWRLIDADELAVHIFNKSGRSFYNLEKIWGDADTYRYEYQD